MNIIKSSRISPGFTLVEIMIVVVIIGILATLGLPAFRQVRMSSQNARFYQDVRVFASAAEMFMLESGEDPFINNAFGDPNSGIIPPGMTDYIKASAFTAQTPLGGLYDFDTEYTDANGVPFFGVGVAGLTVDVNQLQKLDEDQDDGNLGTGDLVRPSNATDRYYYVITSDL